MSRKSGAAEKAIYLYAFTRSRRSAHPLPRTRGVDGISPVEPVACGDILCWVSPVSRRDFAQRLPQNMENLEWLADASVRHQQVVSEIAKASGGVLPTRFGTVYLSQRSLERDVQQHRQTLESAFHHTAEADEWGVKVFAVPGALTAGAVRARSGKEYLRRKSQQLETRRGRAPDPEVQEFAAALQRIAADAAPAGKVSSGQPNLEWQGSFLLRRSRRKQWQTTLERWARKWRGTRRIECTGPWPPYSFVARVSGS